MEQNPNPWRGCTLENDPPIWEQLERVQRSKFRKFIDDREKLRDEYPPNKNPFIRYEVHMLLSQLRYDKHCLDEFLIKEPGEKDWPYDKDKFDIGICACYFKINLNQDNLVERPRLIVSKDWIEGENVFHTSAIMIGKPQFKDGTIDEKSTYSNYINS